MGGAVARSTLLSLGSGRVKVVHAVAAPCLFLLTLGALRALEGQRVAVPVEEGHGAQTISNNPNRAARFRQSN